ncbi:SMI1/KNR4 family protein [Kribbella antibiotica]|uniref:SMI1/KNR4 family protein n=1 Tax=Kribbella antibiotica TaxID=190195 RepID=UPI00140530F1|nr:SMI1/KNR4 family protein [Kribbella antibiotica]
MADSWYRYEHWLSSASDLLHAELVGPAAEVEIADCERSVKQSLPDELRALWSVCGGQTTIDEGVGVLPGFDFLGPAQTAREWQVWEDVRLRAAPHEFAVFSESARSVPEGSILHTYSSPGWIPVWREEMAANYIGIDMTPGPSGNAGQVITFGRDQEVKIVLSVSLGALMEFVVAEAGRVEVVNEADGVFLKHAEGSFLEFLKEQALRTGPLT